MRKVLTVAFCLVLVPAAASAAASREGIHGRGRHAQAAMYATVLDHGHRPIQVLNRLCAKPQVRKRCVDIDDGLRHAISAAVDRPLKWVGHMEHGEGVFWVLSAIRFRPERASFDYSWREPASSGCVGFGHSLFRLVDGEWVKDGGTGGGGCP